MDSNSIPNSTMQNSEDTKSVGLSLNESSDKISQHHRDDSTSVLPDIDEHASETGFSAYLQSTESQVHLYETIAPPREKEHSLLPVSTLIEQLQKMFNEIPKTSCENKFSSFESVPGSDPLPLSLSHSTSVPAEQTPLCTVVNGSTLQSLSDQKTNGHEGDNRAIPAASLSEPHYETIDESHSAKEELKSVDTNPKELLELRFTEDGTFSKNNEESNNTGKQRLDKYQSTVILPDRKDAKVDLSLYSEKTDEESSYFDQIWMNYMERPLLPLKPLGKERSRSCTNLVQAIKGFSIRKTSASSRYSSPEFLQNMFTQKREICNSDGNISENFRIEDPKVMCVTDAVESLATKNLTWYHNVDAREASKRLLTMYHNGAFLIRPASSPTREILHTLCVVYSGRVYNFHVINLKDGLISLGRRKGHQKTFSSMLEMIKYHQNVPISIPLVETGQVAHVYLLLTPSQ